LYTIYGKLGVGAFGVVLECMNKLTNEIVALKIISKETSKQMFRIGPETTEQQVIQDLEHGNIIEFYRILSSIDHVFIEMEKVNGGTLESFIRKRKVLAAAKADMLTAKVGESTESSLVSRMREPVVDEETASSITRDILKGVSQIHKKNYIHRDLKPENILMHEEKSGQWLAKIADFGLTAEILSMSDNKINSVTGTILYMAPEQACGSRYGKRVDMFAIGIIVY